MSKSNITVTEKQIDDLMEATTFEVMTVFDKCTIVAAQLPNGFVLTESSGCVDPANYDPSMGEDICKLKIRDKLWMLEGYALQDFMHTIEKTRNDNAARPPVICDIVHGSVGWTTEEEARAALGIEKE